MIPSLTKFREQIKSYEEGLFLVAVIVMIGLGGFGLGRLSAKYNNNELKINSTLISTNAIKELATPKDQNTAAAADISGIAGTVGEQKIIGNKQSKIYHLENCPGALKMRQANKIFFASVSEAQKAGFRPAGNCPGLP